MGYPAAQVEWQGAIGRHPFSVEFAGHMDMRSGGKTALAGGVPQRVASRQPGADGDAVFFGNVQVDQHPASLFIAIAIQVEHHQPGAGAHHQPGSHGDYPGAGVMTAGFDSAGCKIQGGIGAVALPGAVRASG